MYKLKILAVDDDPDILDLICATVEGDYDIVTVSTGSAAVAKIKQESPDFVILDYNLPGLPGPEICKLLRRDPLFLNTPILMLTGKGEVEDKVSGLEAGVDDYMVKPFEPQELLARIRMLIRRSNVNLDANPLTRLPGNVSINRELEGKIKRNESFAVLYIDLDNFKALNDHYGFQKGDELIKETARILLNSSREKGTLQDFTGHIGGDDFVVITVPEKAEELAKKIIIEFDKAAPAFFAEQDRIKGFIETKGRDGLVQKFGFTTVSIGIISTEQQQFTHIAEIGSVGAELKKLAKRFKESKYVINRRIS